MWHWLRGLAATAFAMVSLASLAQPLPAKTVHIVVPFGAAGVAIGDLDALASTPEQTAEMLASEARHWNEVIAQAKVPMQ